MSNNNEETQKIVTEEVTRDYIKDLYIMKNDYYNKYEALKEKIHTLEKILQSKCVHTWDIDRDADYYHTRYECKKCGAYR